MKPKQFNPEQTLATIADVFARSGYEGTSLGDLVKSTGLGRQSLYNTYGDKRAMLAKSLESFESRTTAARTLSNAELPGLKRIEGFFFEILSYSRNPKYSGCLITNLLLEKGATDSSVLEAASRRWHQARDALKKAIKAGKKDGSIRPDVDDELVSYALMNLLSGMRVTVRATRSLKQVSKVIQLSLNALLQNAIKNGDT